MKYNKVMTALFISSFVLLSGCSNQQAEVETEIVTEVQTEVETEAETESERETEEVKKSYSSSTSKKTVNHYCEVSGCYKEGTRSMTGISGKTEYYCQAHYSEMEDMWNDMVSSSSSSNDSSYSSSGGYGYDSSDPYYSANDHDGDGKLTDEEFQDAMADAIIDMLLAGE